ncbi:MAG: hypothetical protein ACXWGY_05335 [Chthoniobacterales bacterium]
MSAVFELNHAKLATDPRFEELAKNLAALSPIDSRASFNRYCREACRLWSGGIGETSELFKKMLDRIEHTNDGVIRTSWGGVVITLHEPPRVEKYLVVRRGGYLALETHAQKDERLEVKKARGSSFGARLTNVHSRLKSLGQTRNSISSRGWSIASSARRTCSSSSARSIRKEWIRI